MSLHKAIIHGKEHRRPKRPEKDPRPRKPDRSLHRHRDQEQAGKVDWEPGDDGPAFEADGSEK